MRACEKCGGAMNLETLPYLTGSVGAATATDTGLKIDVWRCSKCNHAVLPKGSRPYAPVTIQ